MEKKTEENKTGEGKTEVPVVINQSPAEVASKMLKDGVKPEDLEKMLTLHERWEANQAKKAYHVAMSAFKADPPEITKDRTVSYSAGGGTVAYKHASLANVTEKINTALSKHGLSAAWKTKQNGDIIVTCKITHALGHSEETSISAKADDSGSKNSIQAIGSTITYLQRYTLLSLTGLAAGDQDDDGKGSEPEECIDEQQLSKIRDFVDNNEGFQARLLTYLKIESIEQMPKKDYNKAIKAMEEKK